MTMFLALVSGTRRGRARLRRAYVRIVGITAVTAVVALAPGVVVKSAAAQTLPATTAGLATTITGVVTLVWGDGSPERPVSIGPLAILMDAAGHDVELKLDDSMLGRVGGLLSLNRRRVTVTGLWTTASAGRTTAAVVVTDLHFEDGLGPAAPEAVTGAQPWVSIMCKFSDVSAEPQTLSYFQGMYASTYPGIDHFWRQVSYDNVNIVGSNASGWYTLPHPRSYYIVNDSANLDALFADCTGVADPYVNFAPYVGINMMFNDTLDCCAWGGGYWATLDGVTKSWRVTWEPPWGYANSSVISHEMGHGFGLPHSSFDRSIVYDNCWDVMSDTWNCNTMDPTYGKLGQHTISFHKDLLGWFRAPEKLTLNVGQSTSASLERLATPGWPIAKMVQVPIAGSSSHFYTIEARQTVAYDGGLPGDAVIVSGDLGAHGIAILSVREGLEFESRIESDSAPVHEVVLDLLKAGIEIHCLRDLTRGGLATSLIEIAESSRLHVEISERAVSVEENVCGACEILGLDPLYLANEGRFVAFVPATSAEQALRIMRAHPVCAASVRIGTVSESPAALVTLQSRIGTKRILDMHSGEQLPRIC